MKKTASIISSVLSTASFILIGLFTFIFPLKFGLPYLSNVINFQPRLDVSNFEDFFLEWAYNVWPNEIAMMIILAAFALYIFSACLSKEIFLRFNRMDIIFILFLLSVVPSLFFSQTKNISLNFFFLFLSFYLYYFTLNQHMSVPGRRNILFFVFLVSFIAVMLQGVYQFFYGIDETIEFIKKTSTELMKDIDFKSRILSRKVFSTFIYPNTFAGYLVLALPVSMSVLFSRNRKELKGFILSLFFITTLSFAYLFSIGKQDLIGPAFLWAAAYPVTGIFCLFKTMSEGGMISILLAFLAVGMLLLFFRKKYLMNAVIIFAMAVSLFLAWRFIPSAAKTEMSEKLRKSYTVREQYYRAAYLMVGESPLFGSGLGSFGVRYSGYKLPEAEETQMTHNIFLQMFIESGALSALFLLAFFVGLIVHAFQKARAKKEDSGNILPVAYAFYLVGFAGAFLHNMMDFDFYVPSYGFMLMLASSFAVSQEPAGEGSREKSGAASYVSFHKAVLLVLAVCLVLFLGRLFSRKLLAFEHYRRAEAYFQIYDAERMSGEMRRSISLDPLNDMYYYEMARKLVSANRYKEAEPFFEIAIKLCPGKPYYHFEYAAVMARNDSDDRSTLRRKKIEEEMEKARNLYPTKKYYQDELEKFRAFLERSEQ
jgi:O-antigen ligase